MLPPDDILDILKNQEIPAPDQARKAATILAAREKFSQTTQVKSLGARLLHITGLAALGNGMEAFMNKKHLMRGTATAAIVLVVAVGGLFYPSIEVPSGINGASLKSSFDGANATSNRISLFDALSKDKSESASRAEAGGYTSLAPVDGLSAPTSMPSEQVAASVVASQSSTVPERADTITVAPPAAPQPQLGEMDLKASAKMVMQPAMPTGNLAPLPGMYEQDSASVVELRRSQPVINSYESQDKFAGLPDNPWQEVAAAPVSTFSSDVDTASYSVLRRMLRDGVIPERNAVRVEELINYFDYDYPLPEDKSRPFAPTVVVYPTPWNANTKLMHIGIKGYELPANSRPRANIVLLVDVSGSMGAPNKLQLAKAAFSMMVENLQPTDTVAIVTYANDSGVVLEPTKVENKQRILDAIESLNAGGGTAGAEGLRTAYSLAKQNMDKDGSSRVIMATDGDFNVGVYQPGQLASYIASERQSGVFLSVLGFGMGNYRDVTMQSLAQNGNGVAAYIDTMSEARKVLGQQILGTLFTIAKDVKYQVEFNPKAVTSYRLLGYETRALKREDFDNDKVDAGDIGAGHVVTAIYEIRTADTSSAQPESRYAEKPKLIEPVGAMPDELAFLKMRYKLPDSDTSQLITRPVVKADVVQSLDQASVDVRFAASVAAFGQLLRGSSDMAGYNYRMVEQLAEGARGPDKFGYRAEFLELVRLAGVLRPNGLPQSNVAFPPPTE